MGDDSHIIRNTMSQSTAEIVLQASIVNGDVHISAERRRVPHQLPARLGKLLNQIRVYGELSAGMSGRPELDDPKIKVVLGTRGSGKSMVAIQWLHDHMHD